jgi:hypothetical protein
MELFEPRTFVRALLLSIVCAGCLPDSIPVEGRLLFPGRNIDRPSFLRIGGADWVQFEQRTSEAVRGRGSTADVHLVNWDTGAHRVLVSNRSDRWGVDEDADGIRYYMQGERTFPSPDSAAVATLARVSLEAGIVETIPDVTSFGAIRDGVAAERYRFYYRQMVAGSDTARLHLRSPDGADRVIGEGVGPLQITEQGHIYFVTGEERVLTRLERFDGPLEPIRKGVTRFLLSGDERFVLLTAVEAGKGQTLALDLVEKVERKVPGNPCCWLQLAGPSFVYAEAATGTAPARLHTFGIDKGTDEVLELPPGLVDVVSITGRPDSEDTLFIDSRRQIAQLRPGRDPRFRMLDLRPTTPQFSPDGKQLLYIEPEQFDPTVEGRLMIVDGDFERPPRQISPRGALVGAGGFFFISGPEPLVFWAHYARGNSDLYFANPLTGSSRVVAESISEVTVTARRIVGIVRLSLQDLVGDLVERDPVTGDELVLGHGVSDFSLLGSKVAFVVRERVVSPREGLWATRIVRPVDGGADGRPFLGGGP